MKRLGIAVTTIALATALSPLAFASDSETAPKVPSLSTTNTTTVETPPPPVTTTNTVPYAPPTPPTTTSPAIPPAGNTTTPSIPPACETTPPGSNSNECRTSETRGIHARTGSNTFARIIFSIFLISALTGAGVFLRRRSN
ncbi:Uncharacterised protein [Corynebacterium kutscheri]|uniref:Gram-positive cocci surface proteins LPxTG domain-containing protein n=1 Tax=Corynebacterium kutscheri TaxID=35755 RepID=A0A0F6QZ92_9CORY|nr:hypothetical protein [Corynebacterium kutscheri]AKE41012.1 hypothetical protein UL82_04035 [Corynebacterium kutscheri]VEH06902.1 Uncharacterised protein [Corynebacterium kutscheri]VEH09310.1 Uncharacterised protein [Corynebacterium kutscheri]VEH79398.1 Uncharacterised protein [Corynebacterium kutscheri]